ncbi:MAG: nucleoside deaminase [Rhodospirillaceae bacterium]|jgi:tRNA(Arg) A34 adenosine deaminase TadA|nr:nucleoside deaminase [Rhodospirillaceae bacterium]
MSSRFDLPRRALLSLFGAGLIATPARASSTAPGPIIQPVPASTQAFIKRAFDMRSEARRTGDQAYGAIVVRDGEIIGQSPSRVIVNTDPTAHAEIEAIRDAARRLGERDLSGAILYSSSHPCPMCEAAAYWAGIARMVHGDAASDGGAPSLCG